MLEGANHVLKGANQYVKGNKQRAMGQYMGLMFGIVLILVNRMGWVNMEEVSYMRGRGLILRGIQYIKQLDKKIVLIIVSIVHKLLLGFFLINLGKE
jgi:hypothetical protein